MLITVKIWLVNKITFDDYKFRIKKNKTHMNCLGFGDDSDG